MTILQQWLIEQRQAKDLTLEQLANQLTKPISYVQDVENGKHSLDIVEYLYYCKALGISPNQGLELVESDLISRFIL